MGTKILGFILYLTLSYGVIYLLVSKRFLQGWNIKETQVKAAILAAIVVIIAVGTMLVGPLPMVLLVVALVAFIDYVRSSETLAETAGDRAPDWRLLPSLIDSIALSRRGLAMGSATAFGPSSFQPSSVCSHGAPQGCQGSQSCQGSQGRQGLQGCQGSQGCQGTSSHFRPAH